MIKQRTLQAIVDREGGYVNDPADSGGETNYGVTKATALRAGFNRPLKDMTRADALAIYSRLYWDAVSGDIVAELSEHLVEELVDMAVNLGPSRAGGFLQRSLNVLNYGGSLYPDLSVDGDIGPKTLQALAEYLAVRNELVLVRAVNCLQGAFYIELAEKREKDERFVYGWLKERVTL